MKLQNLAVIFIIIILPISLILSAYTQAQIDTLELQLEYDTKLKQAVYDSIKSYQINTTNNPYAILTSSKKRDIEAAISTFISSLTTGMGIGGYGESYVKPYIPAILFTLYDGYYIYTPTLNSANNKYEHILKPYTTYSVRYKKGTKDVVVSYTLDNYITVVGTINGTYVNKSGYLINNNGVTYKREYLKEWLYIIDPVTNNEYEKEFAYIYLGGEKTYYDFSTDKWFLYRKGAKVYTGRTGYDPSNVQGDYDLNAMNYNDEATAFTAWVQTNLKDITISDMVLINSNYYLYGSNEKIFDSSTNNFESEDSIFNIHKRDIMKVSISQNLSTSIANYNRHSGSLGTEYNFKMPTLQDAEWNQVTKNICVSAFMQGLPIGFKTYNNYVIINNTRNKDYTNADTLCFINGQDGSSDYHMIDCPYLTDTSLVGYRKIDFERSYVEANTSTGKQAVYYYKHKNLPCYYCIVGKNYDKVTDLSDAKKRALNIAIGRERRLLHY